MSEKNTNPEINADLGNPETPVSYSIQGREFSETELNEILSDYEGLKNFKGKNDFLALGEEIGGYLSQGAEGVAKLRAMLDEAENELGVSRPKVSSLDLEIDDYATDNEKKMAKALAQLHSMFLESRDSLDLTKKEIKQLFSGLMSDIETDKTSSTAVDRVRNELNGFEITSAQIKEAMTKTNTKDPVKAVVAYFTEEVLKHMKQPAKPKPNFVKQAPDKQIDFNKMSSSELMRFAADNPEIRDSRN